MGTYDVQQVCENGHQITDVLRRFPEHGRKHCPDCGAPTISACPSCKVPIRGDYHVEGVFMASRTPIPTHCHECGTAYPWKQKLASVADAASRKDAGNSFPIVEALCTRFHLAVKQLRDRHDSRPTLDVTDEYDVQDLMHAFLRLFFDDVRAEEYTPSYAGGSSRIDFLLKSELLVIEVKMTRKGLGAKELGNELTIDAARYRNHTDCKHLVCFIYDPEGRVNNPRGLEADLSSTKDDLRVTAFVVPRGH